MSRTLILLGLLGLANANWVITTTYALTDTTCSGAPIARSGNQAGVCAPTSASSWQKYSCSAGAAYVSNCQDSNCVQCNSYFVISNNSPDFGVCRNPLPSSSPAPPTIISCADSSPNSLGSPTDGRRTWTDSSTCQGNAVAVIDNQKLDLCIPAGGSSSKASQPSPAPAAAVTWTYAESDTTCSNPIFAKGIPSACTQVTATPSGGGSATYQSIACVGGLQITSTCSDSACTTCTTNINYGNGQNATGSCLLPRAGQDYFPVKLTCEAAMPNLGQLQQLSNWQSNDCSLALFSNSYSSAIYTAKSGTCIPQGTFIQPSSLQLGSSGIQLVAAPVALLVAVLFTLFI